MKIFCVRHCRASESPAPQTAPRLRGPARQGPGAMVVGQVVYLCQVLLAHEKCRKACKSHC